MDKPVEVILVPLGDQLGSLPGTHHVYGVWAAGHKIADIVHRLSKDTYVVNTVDGIPSALNIGSSDSDMAGMPYNFDEDVIKRVLSDKLTQIRDLLNGNLKQ